MRFPMLATAFCLVALAGCAETSSTSNLTVSGPSAEVERFARAQTDQHPGLSITETAETAPGQSRVVFEIAGPATSQDIVDVSERAMAARLSVSFSSAG
jgi:flagellar basal body L-ring protein FlgH